MISLFEDRRGDSEGCPPSLIDLIVKEQMRFMDLGKSKADSLEAAIDKLSVANKDVVITLKASSSSSAHLPYMEGGLGLGCDSACYWEQSCVSWGEGGGGMAGGVEGILFAHLV